MRLMNAKKEVPGSAWETSRLPKAKQKGNRLADKGQAEKTAHKGSEARFRHPSELQIPTICHLKMRTFGGLWRWLSR